MATISAVELTRAMISYQVVNDRASLTSLLKRNGVTLPSDASDADVTAAILVASGKSDNFKRELSGLLAGKTQAAGERFSSFVAGDDMFGFTGLDDFQNVDGPGPARTQLGNVQYKPVQISASRMASIQAQAKTEFTKKGKTGAGRTLRAWEHF